MKDKNQFDEVEIRLRGYQRPNYDYTKARYSLLSMKYYAQLRAKKIIEVIKQIFPQKENLSILDVGCGTGVLLKTIINELRSNQYYGLDFSEQMLDNTVLNKMESERVELLRGSAFELPFKDNSLDVLVSTRFIHQYSDELKMDLIEEFRRVLKRDGIAIIEFYSIGPWILRYPLKFFKQKPGKYFLHCISGRRLENVINQPYQKIPIMLPFHTFIIKATSLKFFMRLNKFMSKMRLIFAFEQILVVTKKI